MDSHNQALAHALKLFESGAIAQAEMLCEQVVRENPRHAGGWNLLSAIAGRSGKPEAALACMERAVSAAPGAAPLRSNLGVLLHQLGRTVEAEAAFREAIRLDPNQADAFHNLANLLRQQGRLSEAETSCLHALELRPDHAEAHNTLGNILEDRGLYAEAMLSYQRALKFEASLAQTHGNLGNVLRHLGRFVEAEACYRQSLALWPNQAMVQNNLGTVLRAQDRFVEAEASYRRALELRPSYPESHNNLGNVLRQLGRYSESEASYRRALELRPEYAEAHNDLGIVLMQTGRSEAALACYRRALALNPNFAGALGNLANELRGASEQAEAEAYYRRALELQPNNAEIHVNFAFRRLLQGDLEHGFRAHERRLKFQDALPSAHPQWDGSPLSGRTILLNAEQGLGDTLQFVRYAARVKHLDGTVLVACPAELVALVRTCPGVDRVVTQGSPLPPIDVEVSLMSLPALLKSTLDTIPSATPYLFADAALTEHWRQELGKCSEFKIGIVWQGKPRFEHLDCRVADLNRSTALANFEPLARLPGVQLFSLQKGYGTEQLAGTTGWGIVPLGDQLGDFMDTAAVMLNLDLIVSVDTSVVHLAGALGRPVWTALAKVGCWRWLLDREDNPWYPTMRLFRQRRVGDWEDVFERIAEAAACTRRSRESGGICGDRLETGQ